MVVVAFFSYIFDGRGYMHTLCALTCLLLFFFFKGVREAGQELSAIVPEEMPESRIDQSRFIRSSESAALSSFGQGNCRQPFALRMTADDGH